MRTIAITGLWLLVPVPVWAAGAGWIVMPLGLMLGGAMLLTVVLANLKQLNILAFITTGMAMGIVGNHVAATPEALEALFPGVHSIVAGFRQIGIILIFFMAGLLFNPSDITKRFRLVLIFGIGYLSLNLVLFSGAGFLLVGTDSFTQSIYFALCLTVPSGLLVGAAVNRHNTENSLQGQIVLGIAVLSTLFAVILLAKLDASSSLTTASPLDNVANLWLTEQLMLLVIALLVLARLALDTVVRYLLRSAELLFVGTLGYCMGVAAICGYLGISPEAGAFFAGVSIGVLPYRLDVVDKVQPLKAFGEILFFLTLGLEIAAISGSVYLANLGVIALLVLLVFFIKPIIIVIVGYFSRQQGYLTFVIGTTVNQSSEIALIVALLAWKGGVFNDRLFAIVCAVSILSFILSAMLHPFQEKLYTLCKPALGFLNQYLPAEKLCTDYRFACHNHVVLLSFNEISEEVADIFHQRGERVLLITADPDIIRHFKKHRDSNIIPLYANISEKGVWKDYCFQQARIVIACNGQRVDLNRELAEYLKTAGVPFLAIADSIKDSLALYDAGARYVIQPDYLASRTFRNIFATEIDKPSAEAFVEEGYHHWRNTRGIRNRLGEIFKLV
jgi:Kef-type K+ transport system membrane component KefB